MKPPQREAPPGMALAQPTASPPITPQRSASEQPVPTLRALPPLSPGGAGVSHSRGGMVSSVERFATQAGVDILQSGGNAVDAAVAVAYALAVTHPSAGNLGGGGFLLVKANGQPTRGYDFRERAPYALTQQHFDALIAKRGFDPRASGVPGSVAGLNHVQRTHGRLSLPQVLAPAIRLALAGHPLGKRQALVLRWSWPWLSKDPAARRLFGVNGRALREGELLRQPELAAVLQRIAEHGDAGFYAGETARALLQYQREHGGLITRQDLADYRSVEREPLHTTYHGFDVDVMAPPSAGGVAVVQMLQMLQAVLAQQPAKQAGQPDHPQSAEGWHLFIEVAKRAHAERRFSVGDPDSVPNWNAQQNAQRWADPQLWLAPHPIVRERTTPASELHPLYTAASKELDHTTHLSVVDQDGLAVSCTTTLSGGFGAKYAIGPLGLVMNNSVAAFGTVGLNVQAPGRRMTSSMSPMILTHQGQLALVIGTPGGDTIPSTLVSVLRQLIDTRATLQQAIDAPRLHHGFVPDALRSETDYPLPAALVRALKARGHAFAPRSSAIGDVNAVLVQGEDLYGYADPREGGVAQGSERQVPAP